MQHAGDLDEDSVRRDLARLFGASANSIWTAERRLAGAAHPHRLAELLAEGSGGRCSLPGLEEARRLECAWYLRTLADWQSHPLWPGLQPRLADARNFVHTALALGLATRLKEGGLDVGLIAESETRSPDLRLRLSPLVEIGIEVKAPEPLWRARSAEELHRVDAGRVERWLHHAAEQLGDRGGIAAVGGILLEDGRLDDVRMAAARWLAKKKRSRILAVQAFSLKIHIRGSVAFAGLDVRTVRNEHYEGNVQLAVRAPPVKAPMTHATNRSSFTWHLEYP